MVGTSTLLSEIEKRRKNLTALYGDRAFDDPNFRGRIQELDFISELIKLLTQKYLWAVLDDTLLQPMKLYETYEEAILNYPDNFVMEVPLGDDKG